MNFKGKLSIITKQGPNKGKDTFKQILNMTLSSFVEHMIVTIISLKVQQMPNIWLTYIGNPLANKFKGMSSKLTSLLNPLISVAPKMFLWNTMKMFYRT